MYRIAVLVFCYQALSEPVTDEPSIRSARQLTECCPCPGSIDAGQDMLAGGQLALASGLDDCPCRPRGADSEGASSVFFPSTLRADRPAMRTHDTKEDSKNLLEPEVALATSMLDTLREATEEEYQDALARDAAKSTADDAVPEESARNVVIIVNPTDPDDSDDIISEPSHVQESRCVHPLGSRNLGRMRSSTKPINMLPETLLFPKLKEPGALHRNLLHTDSNLGASNVEQSIIDINGNRPRFQSRSSILNLPIPLRTILDNIEEANKIKTTSLNLGNINENGSVMLGGPKRLGNPKFESHKNVFDSENLNRLSSNVDEPSKGIDNKVSKLFRYDKLPLNVRNLLKLKDVELIPKSFRSKAIRKSSIDVPKFTIPLGKSKDVDLLKNKCDEAFDFESSTENIQNEPSGRITDQESKNPSLKIDNIITEKKHFIKDTQKKKDLLPSPSQVQPSILKVNDFEKESVLSSQDLSKDENHCDSRSDQDLDKARVSNLDIAETTTISDEKIDVECNNGDADVATRKSIPIDPDNSSSNNIPTFVPLDAQEKQAPDLLPQNQNNIDTDTETCDHQEIDASREANKDIKTILSPKALNDRKIVSTSSFISPLTETLTSFRKNFNEKIKNLKKMPVKTEFAKFPQNVENKSVSDEQYENDTNDFTKNQHLNDESKTKLNDDDTASSEDNDTIKDISMNDLQKMSDNLLNLNLKSQNEKILVTNAESNKKSENDDLKSIKCIGENINNVLLKTISDNDVKSAEINTVDSHTQKNEENANPLILHSSDSLHNDEKSFKSVDLDNEQNEMDTGASDTIINTLPNLFNSINPNIKLHSPILENIVVQPTNDPLNLLGKPIGNVINFNNNLPTLGELRERIANIFNTNDKSTEEDLSSIENDDTCNPLKVMTSEASTTDFRRKLPSREDLNVDIFRNKPLTSSFPDRVSAPRLNLNSYRSKVPTPSNLELKPVTLQSGRPTLPIGSNRKTATRKGKPSNFFDNKPLQALPTIEDLRNTLHLTPKNALGGSKLESHLFPKILRSDDVEDIAETLRLNTENTIKGLQRKMESSLKRVKSNIPLDNTIAKPNELLDDMNDKLKAIHYDLNDRLSSIHENILDSSRINSLTDNFRTPENRNVMTNLRQNKAKPIPARLRTAASTITAHNVDPNAPLWATDTENNSKRYWNKLTNEQLGGSATPAREELLMPSESQFQNTHPLRLNPKKTQFLSERTSPPDLQRKPPSFGNNINKPTFRTPLNPFNPNKVTISFGTTTIRPLTISRPASSALPQADRHSSSLSMNNRPDSERVSFNHQIKTFADSKLSPTQISSFRNTAPITSFDDEFQNDKDDVSVEQNPNLKSPVLRQMPSSNPLMMRGFKTPKSTDFSESLENSEFEASRFKVHPPKATENSFMSKVRGAIDMRRSEMASKSIKDVNTEMLSSPSQNTNVVVEEPLKENVSYRCRMVCTKEYNDK